MYEVVLAACLFLPVGCADGACDAPRVTRHREVKVERTVVVDRVARPVLRRDRFISFRRTLRRHGGM